MKSYEIAGTYRKRPIVIEAFQMTKERRWDNSEWPEWLNRAWQKEPGEGSVWINPDADMAPGHASAEELVCGTLEGVHRIDWDDWIIQGIKGELYPCKPDIFAATYEKVKETEIMLHLNTPSPNFQVFSAHFCDVNGNPAGGTTCGRGFAIAWQNGPLSRGEDRAAPNGAFVEDIILAARDRLDYYQGSKFACDHNADAIRHLGNALAACEARTADREARNVEGTHKI